MKLILENETSTRQNILRNLLKLAGYKDVRDLQKQNKLDIDGVCGLASWSKLYIKLLNVLPVNFEGYYYKQASNKKQIVWHHSAGSDDAVNMFEWWKRDNVTHVATCIGIEKSGRVVKGYDEGFWAHHIGMSNAQNQVRNIESIAVELTNWGNLSANLTTWANTKVAQKDVIELNYKGSKFYEIYPDSQIKALELWTVLVALRFDIPLTYNEKDMWEVSQDAINGKAGIYTHNSFISWKTDVSPQPKLIEMAKKLIEYTK